jgi:23S rRNA (adenine2503-C2)-methyltransferase
LAIEAEIFNEGKTQKAAIRLADGEVTEAVLIKNADGRHTVCISSQIGCALGCVFCATGKMGFKRNLTALEMIEQVLVFSRRLKTAGDRVDNVVFMGMGEPFLNWLEVKKAIEILNDEESLNIAARSISISTCGLPEGIKELAKFPLQVNLAVSLHAPNDELRRELMPIANSFGFKELFAVLNSYLTAKGRKVMFEYVMIDGVNDDPVYAEELAKRLNEELPKKLSMVNLIPYNPTGNFRPSSPMVIKKFRDTLMRRGVETTVRESFGGKIGGACGQLAGRKSN